MDNEIELLLNELLEEVVEEKKLTKEDFNYKMIMILVEAQTKNQKQMVILADEFKIQFEFLQDISKRLSIIELVLLPHLKEINGIGEC